jgi:hypothetical protein
MQSDLCENNMENWKEKLLLSDSFKNKHHSFFLLTDTDLDFIYSGQKKLWLADVKSISIHIKNRL